MTREIDLILGTMGRPSAGEDLDERRNLHAIASGRTPLAERVRLELERLRANGQVWTDLTDEAREAVTFHAVHGNRVELTEPGDYLQLACEAASCWNEEESQGTVVVLSRPVAVACCIGHETGLVHVKCTAPPSGRSRVSAGYLEHWSASCPTCMALAQRALADHRLTRMLRR